MCDILLLYHTFNEKNIEKYKKTKKQPYLNFIPPVQRYQKLLRKQVFRKSCTSSQQNRPPKENSTLNLRDYHFIK